MKKPVISIGVVIAFITPYISIVSGLAVAWLFVHFHWLGIFHVQQSAVATTIAGAVVFGLTAILTYIAAHAHWLPIVLTKLAAREASNTPMAPGTGTVPPGTKSARLGH